MPQIEDAHFRSIGLFGIRRRDMFRGWIEEQSVSMADMCSGIISSRLLKTRPRCIKGESKSIYEKEAFQRGGDP
jgi:hypothetical protein